MKKKSRALLCTGAILGVIAVSGVFAYLTDTETATNKFTIGEVDIQLIEENWDNATDANSNDVPDFAENLVPNQTVAKDPKVKNIGQNDAYVYLTVEVPKESVITAAANGTLNNSGAATSTPLFSYIANTTDWTEITSAKVETTTSVKRVYYYKQALEVDQETSELFEEVTLVNLIEGQVDPDVTKDIKVNAYAIQSDNLPSGTTIEGAYQIYVNQNSTASN